MAHDRSLTHCLPHAIMAYSKEVNLQRVEMSDDGNIVLSPTDFTLKVVKALKHNKYRKAN